ncbi:High-affinity glucose transporter rgt2 [Arthrobotrys conoides]|uniref:High-affinity glucose transporter rgt2 n=1 Tax=Arthrobotrys conoides TaxID=74498 RepID=A0AAN8RPV5_9PEZI
MMLLPETPRFLIKRNRFEDAAKSLSTLRRLPPDHPEILAELNEIKANHEYEMSIGQTSYKELLSNHSGFLRKRLLTGVGIQIFQQLSGLWLVDNWGRRNLLLFGAAGMFICQFIVAIVGTVSQSQPAHSTLVAFVCIYIFFFASSWVSLCSGKYSQSTKVFYTDTRALGACCLGSGEIFPLKARAKGLSITTAANWLLNWAIGYATPYMVDSGPGNANLGAKVFFVWGSFCALSFAFVWAFIYETKGFTLEQVDEIYAKVPHAWNSPGFEPTVKFIEVAEEVQQQPYEGGRRPTLSEIEASAIRRKSSVGLPEKDEKVV